MKLSRLAFAAGLGFASLVGQAQAAVVMDIFQSGGDVMATGSGTLDLTDLVLFGTSKTDGPGVIPTLAYAEVGPFVDVDTYLHVSGPASFGPGAGAFPSDVSGNPFGVVGNNKGLFVPAGYASGSSLSGSATFAGETIASMKLTPGKYVYTWGSGADADSLTINIGEVPEPATWAMLLLGFAGIGFAGYRASRATAAASFRA